MQPRYLKIPTFFLLSLYVVLACSEQNNGFDEICTIYVEAKNSSLARSRDELSEYVFTNIKNRVNYQEAVSVHDAIFGLSPSERYPLFRQAAESKLRRTWDCPAMKVLLK